MKTRIFAMVFATMLGLSTVGMAQENTMMKQDTMKKQDTMMKSDSMSKRTSMRKKTKRHHRRHMARRVTGS